MPTTPAARVHKTQVLKDEFDGEEEECQKDRSRVDPGVDKLELPA